MRVFARKLFDGKRIRENIIIEIEGERIIGIDEGMDKSDLTAEFVMPALIDAHSHIGLDRHSEGNAEDDTNEKEDSIITFADALDGIQMDDRYFKDSVESGVLYSCVMHGSGNIIGSKAVVIRNFKENTKEAFVKYAGYKAAFGYNPKSTEDWKGTRFSTRIGVVAYLRRKLLKAENELNLIKKGKKEKEEVDIEDLFFIELLEGREKLRVHLHKEDDLHALLRLADRFSFKFSVEHTCSFNRESPYKELKERNISVVYGPLDSFAYKVELKHEEWRNIKHLINSGVFFGLMSDHPVILQSSLFLTLRHFLRVGYGEENTLALLTSRNAEILELHDLGRVEKSYKASLLLYSNDPFHLSTKLENVIMEGELKEIEY